MKKSNSVWVIVLLIASLVLSGCSSAAADTSTEAASTENASGGLNEPTKLALGILSLEDGEQAISAEQAKELLTLWQAYQTLGNSETTAKVEMEALVKQIGLALTSEQSEAIEAMNLTSESMAEVMQGMGMEMVGGMPPAEGTPEAGTDFGTFPGGGMPSGGVGGMPSGGSGMPNGSGGMPGGGFQMARPETREMSIDDSGSVLMDGAMGTPDPNLQNQFSSVGSQVNPMLLRVLISMLETKVGAAQ